MTKDEENLKSMGFIGFKTMRELMSNPSLITNKKGVYVVSYKGDNPPKFLNEGTGGFFKGKDPNVSISELEDNWVDGTSIVYIGKAGGAGSSVTLLSRLKQYLRFGQGANVGHWGGRYIWQIANSKDLIVCWKPLDDAEPREIEHQMIEEFKAAHHGLRPFANLQD